MRKTFNNKNYVIFKMIDLRSHTLNDFLIAKIEKKLAVVTALDASFGDEKSPAYIQMKGNLSTEAH